MDENKELAVVEETQADEVTTIPTEEEDEDEGSAIGGLIALIGGGIAFGVGATAFTMKVKAKFEKKRDEKRRKAEHDILMDHCPDGFEVVMTDDGPKYVEIGQEDDDEPATPAPAEEKEEK